MRKRTNHITVSLIAVSVVALASLARADHDKDSLKDQCSANEVIGKTVKNLQNEELGKVQDLIVNLDAGTVPYAIIAHGGVLGAGRSKTAVSLDSLQPAPDRKSLLLLATKEQLRAATKTQSGGWANVADAEWAKNVDGFYGSAMNRGFSDRQKIHSDQNDRTFVRDPAPKGAEVLMTPADAALCQKICESTDLVQIRVENGVTHIYGQVDDEEERKSIESKVRSVQGVNKVESHLRVKNQ